MKSPPSPSAAPAVDHTFVKIHLAMEVRGERKRGEVRGKRGEVHKRGEGRREMVERIGERGEG